MQEMLRVLVLENSDRCIQRSLCTLYFVPLYLREVFIDPLHHQQRYILVRHAIHDGMLQHVRERPVTNVMQQNSDHGACLLRLRDLHSFQAQGANRLVHEVHSA